MNMKVWFKTSLRNSTTQVLVQYPGLKVGATTGNITLDGTQFSTDLGQLYKQLKAKPIYIESNCTSC